MAKLTEGQVREMKRLKVVENTGNSELARMFGVSPSMVSSIMSGRSWGHIAYDEPTVVRDGSWEFLEPVETPCGRGRVLGWEVVGDSKERTGSLVIQQMRKNFHNPDDDVRSARTVYVQEEHVLRLS
jgi:hypothetical protein